jgi:hypothetical protein
MYRSGRSGLSTRSNTGCRSHLRIRWKESHRAARHDMWWRSGCVRLEEFVAYQMSWLERRMPISSSGCGTCWDEVRGGVAETVAEGMGKAGEGSEVRAYLSLGLRWIWFKGLIEPVSVIT